MTRAEKIMALEALWADLSRDEAAVEVPEWHLRELAETEQKVAAGQDKFVDWETAKKELRNELFRRR